MYYQHHTIPIQPQIGYCPTQGLGTNGDTIPEDNTTTIAPTEQPEHRIEQTSNPWMLSTPFALQSFSIASGIAGGLAGFILATRTQNSLRVSAPQVLMATGLSALATFGAIFIIRTVEEW